MVLVAGLNLTDVVGGEKGGSWNRVGSQWLVCRGVSWCESISVRL